MFFQKKPEPTPEPVAPHIHFLTEGGDFYYSFLAALRSADKTEFYPYRVRVYDANGVELGDRIAEYADITKTAKAIAERYIEALSFPDFVEGEGVITT